MTDYLVTDITGDVRNILDENRKSTALISASDIDTLSLDGLIQSVICDAVESVHKAAPVRMLSSCPEISQVATIDWTKREDESYIGWVKLDDDFMRFVFLQLSGWKYGVTKALTQEDDDFREFFSEFSGVSGHAHSPRCCIAIMAVNENDMGLYLGFTGSTKNTDIILLSGYIPIPKIVNSKISICPSCYRAVIYYCAGLVCLSMNSKEQAEQYFTVSKDIIK